MSREKIFLDNQKDSNLLKDKCHIRLYSVTLYKDFNSQKETYPIINSVYEK